MTVNAHDQDDPSSIVNFLDAQMEATLLTCRHCRVTAEPVPASGTRWVVGIDHEPGCPEHAEA